MDIQKERLAALIEFTKQTLLINKKPIINITQHKHLLRTEEQIIDLPGVSLNKDMGTENETWLYIERLHETPTPEPENKLLKLWINYPKNYSTEPHLKEKVETSTLLEAGFELTDNQINGIPIIEDEEFQQNTSNNIDSHTAFTYFDNFSDKESVLKALDKYIKVTWKPWLEDEKPIRNSIKLYSDLFSLSQELQGNLADTKLELVWGVGMALWNKFDDHQIRYPLLTHLVEISLDKDTMALSIKPSQSPVKLETEPFSSHDNPNLVTLIETQKAFFNADNLVFNPFLPSTFSPVLNAAASLLDPSGQYLSSQDENALNERRVLPKATNNLVITDTWVLMARPRGDHFVLQDLERFSKKLIDNDNLQIPSALSVILSEPASENHDLNLAAYRGISAITGNDESQAKPKDLYFPKPYNDEQVSIIQMLELCDGVVVQGPPGTGKTHTIANIICHYLALGKRVLVTSMKDPALSVLKDQLPKDIQPLAVSLLSNDKKSLKQFESSIRKISSEVSSINRNQYQATIEQIENEIDATHAQLVQADNNISYWGRLNLNDIIIDKEVINPLDAAKLIALKQNDINWFPDKLNLTESFTPQFSDDDIAKLRKARLNIKNDLIYFNAKLPNISQLPTSEQIIELHENLLSMDELIQAETNGSLPKLSDNTAIAIQNIKDTLNKVLILKTQLKEIKYQDNTWSDAFKQHLVSQEKNELITYFRNLKNEIKELLAKRMAFITKPVTLPSQFDKDSALTESIKNLSEGRSPFGLVGIFGKGAKKKLLEEISILGAKPTTTEDWRHVLTFIEFKSMAKSLITRWNALSADLSLPHIEVSLDYLTLLESTINLVDTIEESILLEKEVRDALQSLFPNWEVSTDDRYTINQLIDIEHILNQHLGKYNLSETTRLRVTLEKLLSQGSGPIIEKFNNFINNNIGNKDISINEVKNGWSNLINGLEHIHHLSKDFEIVSITTQLIASSGAVNWAKMLQEIPPSDIQDELLPDNWSEVWRLNRLMSFVNHIDSRRELASLAEKRHQLENDLSRLYQEVIAKKTWLYLAKNATPDVRAALVKYRAAIMRIGKGTGKRAPRYRKEAQRASEQANSAIPCWIMPHYRISESLPTEFGSFDLVIIDEASQSDLTALPALLRAQKVLVVGDDKQVSPDSIGLDEEKIKELMDQYLYGQVEMYRSQMSPDRSIYDLFKVAFAGSDIMLKEHFRCAPAIIEFSKKEFYDHELKPLRVPKPSEQLNPPLIDVYITDGFRNHKKINPPEARFIVDEIKTIVENPDNKGRTIGVISLLGNEQAREIMEMLSRELGEQAIQDFDIACGDARTFQGKERDIIFLSLIIDRNKTHAQTKESFAQRINVAASRARDRMYLVRSIELDDLSSADIYRAKLVQYFRQPFLHDKASVHKLRDKCESAFEEEVYDILVERGYRVIPQVEVGQYRIDMVVEGEDDNRLAIECDGDRYHGPDKWEADIRRQRTLERAGWRFWRCFASIFVLNKKEVINELLNELAKLNIHPMQDAQIKDSLYTETRRVQAIKQSTEGQVPN